MAIELNGAAMPHLGPTILTVGTFDGLHLGHQHLLRELRRRAAETGLAPLVLSFEPHPLEVLRPDSAPRLLAPGDERLALLAELGVEHVAILPFTRELSAYTAEEFLDRVLVRRFGMGELLMGYDHGFGRGRAGDVDTLRRLGAERGIAVDVVGAFSGPTGEPVSSSTIRRALAVGDLETAAAGLGRRYGIDGRVTSGARRGRLLGYPTLNIEPASPRKLLPGIGVYAVRADTPLGSFGGMMNLGPRPTFGDETIALEVHLFDADADFYGVHVHVELIARLRETRRFADAAELVAQLADDERTARNALTQLL